MNAIAAAPHTGDPAAKQKEFMSQSSTVTTQRQQAVCVRGAHKQYGSKNDPNIILDGLNMTVPKGSIYGLLGASGCGKTTLLSCIVGRRRLNAGEIWLLGGRPGSRGSGMPGPRIGYMPQELALYGEFTLRETLIFFGWIAGMTTSAVDEKIDFLINLLQLPDSSGFVKNLSGGQQRRMSLAAALVHDPELLILDEPTVGLDPLLRNSIWNHLVELTSTGRTVILTTHYIDETRQAHTIGLMRCGKFLAEESPESLLRQYHCATLEDVFLKLSVMQNSGKRRRSSIVHEITQRVSVTAISNPAMGISEEDIGEISGEFGDTSISMSSRATDAISSDPAPPLPPEEESPQTVLERLSFLRLHHMKALIWKNFLWMWRNVGTMAFLIGLPCLNIILFYWTIGHDPTGLTLAVANNELNNGTRMKEQRCPVTTGCNYTMLSCRYLDILDRKGIVIKHFANDADAFYEVKRGRAWGALVFQKNYSESLMERAKSGPFAKDWVLDASNIEVKLDMSNQQIGTFLYRDILYAFSTFIEQIMKDCDMNPRLARIPMRWEKPIYGDGVPNYIDFAAPGIIISAIFFISVAATAGAMLIERNEGMLERYLVNGVTGIEILFSTVVTQFGIMSGQVVLALFCSFCVFDLTLRGQLIWVTVLTILAGLCGMCFGFLVSLVSDNERTATFIGMGSFLPIITLCGIIWPIEGMHPGLKVIALFLPLTQSTESMRSITQRGWSIQTPAVYGGFISTGIWVLVFLTISILLLKFKKV